MRLLIQGIYPAPYRWGIFALISQHYECDVFFERNCGDGRDIRWFEKGNFHLLDDENGRREYTRCLNRLKDYDLVMIYDFLTKAAIKLIIRCRFQHIPYAINCDGVILTEHGSFIRDLVKQYLVKGASACMASGKYAQEYFRKYGAAPEKIHIHPFTSLYEKDIDLQVPEDAKKRELRLRLGLPVEQKIAMAVGRFIPLKRYDKLLAAWKKVPENYMLVLIGGGPEKEKYVSMIKDQELQNVIIKDFHVPSELPDFYRAADLMVHPTSYDCWGLVINEAMAHGLPVVVSDHCVAGLELVKNGENGFLSPLGDDDDFVDKAQKILYDDKLHDYMAKNALQAIKGYTIENAVGIHLGIIRKFEKQGK